MTQEKQKNVPSSASKGATVAGEKPIRSLVKTLSWRVLATTDTILISYLITGSLEFAFSIGGIEVVTKMFLYYFHERLWSKIKLGRTYAPEYEI